MTIKYFYFYFDNGVVIRYNRVMKIEIGEKMIKKLRDMDLRMKDGMSFAFDLEYTESSIKFHYEILKGWDVIAENTIKYDACDQQINDDALTREVNDLYSIYTYGEKYGS